MSELKTGNPEALHDVGQDKSLKVGPDFVNPGTPEEALVNREQLYSATIRGNGADVLKKNIIK